MVITKRIFFDTKGNTDIINLSPLIEEEISQMEISNGVISIFEPGATGAVTTIEYESGLVDDFEKLMNRLVPKEEIYDHDKRWGDGNGHSHLRASLLGPGLTVPVANGQMQLGKWQQVAFVDFDNRPRHRTLLLTVIGE